MTAKTDSGILIRNLLDTVQFNETESRTVLEDVLVELEMAEDNLERMKDKLSVFLENHVNETGSNTVRLHGKQYTVSSRKGTYYLKKR